MATPSQRSRIRGSLLAGAIGDALGAPVEFMTREAIVARFGPSGITGLAEAYGRVGAITDDTQMTLFTAEGLLNAHVRWSMRGIGSVPGMMQRAYWRWLSTQGLAPPGPLEPRGWLLEQPALHSLRAPGRTCISALQQGEGLRADNQSKGCGGVMRVAPIGLFHGMDGAMDLAFDQACEAAAVTHGHVTGQLASGTLAAMLYALMRGRTLEQATGEAMSLLAGYPGHGETTEILQEALELSRDAAVEPASAMRRLGGGWVAEEALAIALYCALRDPVMERALVLAVNHDGDSDSTGSIAGQLLGAWLGEEAIPARWRDGVELAGVILQVADDLHDAHSMEFDAPGPATPDVRAFLARYMA